MRFPAAVALASIGSIASFACEQPSSSPQGSGQTGSIGSQADECTVVADCQARTNEEVAALRKPAAANTAFSGAACINLGISGGPSGPSCECQVAGGDGRLAVGPVGLDCYALGRAGACLWPGDEFAGCVVGEAGACDAVCAKLAQKLNDDAATPIDAEAIYSSCEQGACHSVVRIGEQCYADGSYTAGLGYDCSLGGDAIVRAHQADTNAVPPLLPETRSSYVEGTDGFVQLISSRMFSGTTQSYSGFGAMAQFAVISGKGGSFGTVVDPLDGLDDCGVTQLNGSGVAPNVDFYDAAEVSLLDGSAVRTLALSSASHDDFYQYIAELSEQGVAPRFGQSYGVRVAGGTFGAVFESHALQLPQELVLNEPGITSHFEQSDLRLTWTGKGEQPLYVTLLVTKVPSDLANAYQIDCVLKDDGEFVLPGSVLVAAPSGFVHATFTREDRRVATVGDHALLLDGQVEVTHEFALGPMCDKPELAAACATSASTVQAAYEQCHLTPPSQAELCPDYVTTSCQLCPEYFDCVAKSTRCTADGFELASGCSCPAPK